MMDNSPARAAAPSTPRSHQLSESYGEIDTINLKMDPMTGRSRGFAFVVFKSIEGIQAALQQNAHVVKVS